MVNLTSYYKGLNRANGMGESLENYIKDLLCGTLRETNASKRSELYDKYLSYIGNQNNPPNLIIKKGDALEVKKIESLNSSIALNSSYPKSKLFSSNPKITKACRECENWHEKDIIYTIGIANKGKLKLLWLVYGDCYAASEEVYKKMQNKITAGIIEIPEVEFSNTKELARINKIDPLGITYFRIRGMWGIENPMKVFKNTEGIMANGRLSVNAIMLAEKYASFPKEDRQRVENNKQLKIKNIKIKSPDNPARLLKAKLITFGA
jgi:hypothetical protein